MHVKRSAENFEGEVWKTKRPFISAPFKRLIINYRRIKKRAISWANSSLVTIFQKWDLQGIKGLENLVKIQKFNAFLWIHYNNASTQLASGKPR